MRKSNKFILAAGFVGLAAAGGSALTGSGLTNNAGASQFVGGTVTQGVTGATLSSVAYTFGDPGANTAIHSAVLTFGADADGKTVAIAFTGGNAVAFTCTAVEVTGHTSTCTTAGADVTGATSAAITVS
jgi:hypothetical protein